jgi:hypothetical protein
MSTLTAYPFLGYDFLAVSTMRSRDRSRDYFDATDATVTPAVPFRTASEQRRRDAIDTILELPQKYREANLNGEDAVPIPDAAFHEARTFLQKLPDTFPLPEVTPEPDGYLGLEWHSNKWLLYVVSFNGTGALSCSGLIGSDRIYGTQYMDDGIPTGILSNIAIVVR